MPTAASRGGVGFALLFLVACDSKPVRQPPVDPSDTVQVEAGRVSDESSAIPESVEVLADPAAQEFLARLQDAMLPVRDTLRLEFDRILSLPSVAQRDNAILELDRRWGGVQAEELNQLLAQSVFTSRMWIDSIKGADTAFERRVRQILAGGGKFLEYNEGFSAESDLGARSDLLDSAASPALAERFRLDHQGNGTQMYNDAGIVAPLDTLVGRIQGWEAFARRHPGTPPVAWADAQRRGYLHSLLCGATNTRFYTKGQPDPEFLAAWQLLASGPEGPSQRLAREWLDVLSSEKGRLTPEANAWLAKRGYSPEVHEDDGI